MNIPEYFKLMMKKAVSKRDLKELETLSQTILNLMNQPHKYNNINRKIESKNLQKIFGEISIYIVYLTNRSVSYD